jgi:hypothetical protein
MATDSSQSIAKRIINHKDMCFSLLIFTDVYSFAHMIKKCFTDAIHKATKI